MKDGCSIEARGISKSFRLRHGGTPTLKSAVLDILRGGRSGVEFWALKEVNFEVRTGETLGIIGSNGAGKSTLLSIVAGTMSPTTGSMESRGSVSSLLELGAGFHPDLTGRENVFLYGAIMGISRARMQERFDAIVEFAGIRQFIDQPVKHYSSGMYVRLGFAVAVEVDPDVLLIDEVLAVGDESFQQKCLAKMAEFRERGKTMLIISHDLKTVQSVSDRILLLDEGRILGLGDPGEVVTTYQKLTRARHGKLLEREWGTGEAKITGVEFMDQSGKMTNVFKWNEPLVAKISYHANSKIADPVFGFGLSDEHGRVIFGSNTQIENWHIPAIEGDGSVTLKLDRVVMCKGTYKISFSMHSQDHKTNYHRIDNRYTIEIETDTKFEGYCHMPVSWRV